MNDIKSKKQVRINKLVGTDKFYTNLPAHKVPFKNVIESHENFTEVPDGWSVVITDIENSTKNIEKNRYQEVNMLAVSSLILAINIAKDHELEFPFIYGGDGATVLYQTNILICIQTT